MNLEKMRELSVETSMVAVRNIGAANHTGLVTLRMERGVIRRVWCGGEDGLLVWDAGKTACHIILNVEGPLEHG